jgi:hypothetical protein
MDLAHELVWSGRHLELLTPYFSGEAQEDEFAC